MRLNTSQTADFTALIYSFLVHFTEFNFVFDGVEHPNCDNGPLIETGIGRLPPSLSFLSIYIEIGEDFLQN